MPIHQLIAAQDSGITADRSKLYRIFARGLADQVGRSSVAAGWSQDLVVESWSLPPTEYFNHTAARHRLVVCLGSRPVFVRWNDDGCAGEAMISPGASHLMPQGMTSVTHWHEPLQIASFELSSAVIERLLDGRVPAPAEQLTGFRNATDPIAYDLTRRVVTELMQPTESLYGEMLCLAMAVHLLRRYGRKAVRAAKGNGRLSAIQARRVLDYMHANLDNRLSVRAIASVVGMSEAYFARAFRATFKESPHRVVLRWRLERAARLLAKTRCSLAEAATAAGFCDQAHLTNAMRRHFGKTPGALMRFAKSQAGA